MRKIGGFMLTAVVLCFAVAPFAPWLQRMGRSATGWIIAALPVGLLIYFARLIGVVAGGDVVRSAYTWMPTLGVRLSFYLDGLSLLFALLITGVGALVLIYSGGYLVGHPHAGRFYAFMLIFMASMLGLVLANDLITLFVFWELTTISSFLLIGFEHARREARAAALQALMVTGGGGLALLVGSLLLGQAGGSLELSSLLNQGATVRAHAHYAAILGLMLFAAFSKSAQVPFHFWLPSAMAAPTPVSAYLHSATMVKAGIYLLARLSPVLGGSAAWSYSLATIGTLTMLLGAYLAWQQNDLKRSLAYSTISALGMLTLLLSQPTPLAAEAMLVFLLSHALYKGALFLVVGALDHATGSRDVQQLGGLHRVMPISATASGLALLSMASIPPSLGFIGKELLYTATLDAPGSSANLLIGLTVLANSFYVAAAGVVGLRPFVGAERSPQTAHEAPVSMWLGPMVLAGLGLIVGIGNLLLEPLLSPAVAAIRQEASRVDLHLWHGLNLVLGLSVVTIAAGIGIYLRRDQLCHTLAPLNPAWSAVDAYNRVLAGLDWLARTTTRWLQSGYLRSYVLLTVTAVSSLLAVTLLLRSEWVWHIALQDVAFYEIGLAVLMLLAAVVAVRANSRLAAVAALGVLGYSVALIFILFGAPDLAMTQFAIETLTVILFVLVLYRLPRFATVSSNAERLRDLIIALGAGAVTTMLVLLAINVQFAPPISDYFIETSVEAAHGRNIVNVILVDFRSLDTLGEITVLSLVGLGVYALLRLQLDTQQVAAEAAHAEEAEPVLEKQVGASVAARAEEE